MYEAVLNNPGRIAEPAAAVRSTGTVLLHAAAIAIHEIAWGKRVLAVPPDTSERPTELHS